MFILIITDVEEKVIEELSTFLSNEKRFPTASDLKNMKYLLCVIKETLRMKPGAPARGRTLMAEDTLGGYKLAKGTNVAYVLCSVSFPDFICVLSKKK